MVQPERYTEMRVDDCRERVKMLDATWLSDALGEPSLDDGAPTLSTGELEHSESGVRRSRMPVTGLFISVYIVALVLFSQRSSTVIITTILGLALAVVFVVELVARRHSFAFPAPLVWFAIFLCYCTFQMIYAPGSITMLLTLFQLLVLAIILVNYGMLVGDAAAFDWAVYFAVICTFVYNLVANPQEIDGRIGSTLINPNGYSLLLMIGMLLAFRRLLLSSLNYKLKSKAVLAFILYFSLSVYGIVYLAGSRKGILLTLAASVFLVLYWLWQQPTRRRIWVSIVVVALFASLGYVLYESPQFSRIVDLSNFLEGGSPADTGLLIRNQMLKDGFNLWLQRPFLGFGLDQFRLASGWGTYSHDNYLELLVNTGFVGLLIYIMVYVSAFLSLVRSLRFSGDPRIAADLLWALTVLGVLAAWDLGAVSYYEKLNWLMLSVVIVIAARAKLASNASGHD